MPCMDQSRFPPVNKIDKHKLFNGLELMLKEEVSHELLTNPHYVQQETLQRLKCLIDNKMSSDRLKKTLTLHLSCNSYIQVFIPLH